MSDERIENLITPTAYKDLKIIIDFLDLAVRADMPNVHAPELSAIIGKMMIEAFRFK